MPLLTQRRNPKAKSIQGPVSASAFFEAPTRKSSSSQAAKLQTVFYWSLSIGKFLYRLAVLFTIVAVTIPTFLCFENHRHLLLGTGMDQLCKLRLPQTVPPWKWKPQIDVRRLRNFAHFGDGARVILEITSLTYGMKDNTWLDQAHATHSLVSIPPPHVVSDDFLQIGNCWEFEGSTGLLGILLSEPTTILSISLDYIQLDLISAGTGAKAPKSLRLWGMAEAGTIIPKEIEIRSAGQFSHKPVFGPRSFVKSNDEFVQLHDFHYDIRADSPSQYFIVNNQWSKGVRFRAVVLEVLDNWGGKNTCLYHFAVHKTSYVL